MAIPNTSTPGLPLLSVGNGTSDGKWSPSVGAIVNATELQTVPISATAPTTGQLLYFNGTDWIPVTLAGDASGSPTATTVNSLQGVPLSLTGGIAEGQFLVFNGSAIVPSSFPSSWHTYNLAGTVPSGGVFGSISGFGSTVSGFTAYIANCAISVRNNDTAAHTAQLEITLNGTTYGIAYSIVIPAGGEQTLSLSIGGMSGLVSSTSYLIEPQFNIGGSVAGTLVSGTCWILAARQ